MHLKGSKRVEILAVTQESVPSCLFAFSIERNPIGKILNILLTMNYSETGDRNNEKKELQTSALYKYLKRHESLASTDIDFRLFPPQLAL